MANPYHDTEGRFCSRGEMQAALQSLAVPGKEAEYLAFKAEFDAATGTADPYPWVTKDVAGEETRTHTAHQNGFDSQGQRWSGWEYKPEEVYDARDAAADDSQWFPTDEASVGFGDPKVAAALSKVLKNPPQRQPLPEEVNTYKNPEPILLPGELADSRKNGVPFSFRSYVAPKADGTAYSWSETDGDMLHRVFQQYDYVLEGRSSGDGALVAHEVYEDIKNDSTLQDKATQATIVAHENEAVKAITNWADDELDRRASR